MPCARFDTSLGRCAIHWQAAEVTGFDLPGGRPGPHGHPEEPPAWVAALIARVQRHLAGDWQDFCDLPYAWAGLPEFTRAVLHATLAVKAGHTATYGEIAATLGQPPAASRAVGAALGANPWPLLIPCHRIVAASGRLTGYSGPGGVETKARLLALEGASLL